jgi:Kef-type K+ transport system membrane component KefB
MQEIAPVIAFVGILVFLAHLFTGIFSRTRIPDVILLMGIGIGLGPVLGVITPANFGEVGPVFTTITLGWSPETGSAQFLFDHGRGYRFRPLAH